MAVRLTLLAWAACWLLCDRGALAAPSNPSRTRRPLPHPSPPTMNTSGANTRNSHSSNGRAHALCRSLFLAQRSQVRSFVQVLNCVIHPSRIQWFSGEHGRKRSF